MVRESALILSRLGVRGTNSAPLVQDLARPAASGEVF
jgi:hypothetical protein